MQQGFKPFAPFGQLLHDLRLIEPNLKYSPYIFCGSDSLLDARKMLSGGVLCMALPPHTSVTNYRWSIANLSLILFDSGEMYQEDLKFIALALLDEGAKQVCVYATDPPGVETYHK